MSKTKDHIAEVAGLITEEELQSLTAHVNRSEHSIHTAHNLIMQWLDSQPHLMDRFRQHGVVKAYGARVLQFFYNLK